MDKKIAQLYDNGKVDQAIHLLVQKIDQKPPFHLYHSWYLYPDWSLVSIVRLASVCDSVRLYGADHPHIQHLSGDHSSGL